MSDSEIKIFVRYSDPHWTVECSEFVSEKFVARPDAIFHAYQKAAKFKAARVFIFSENGRQEGEVNISNDKKTS